MQGRVIVGGAGRYLEDFQVGDIYEHRPGRTITESDNINFSLMTMNAHPLHCDAAFAAKSEFGRPLVNSGLTLAIVLGMTVNDVSYRAIASLHRQTAAFRPHQRWSLLDQAEHWEHQALVELEAYFEACAAGEPHTVH